MATRTSARRYAVELMLGACVAWVCAWQLAAIMHRIQHSQWSPAYLLVPVNQTSLYFFPLGCSISIWLALRSGRFNRELLIGASLVWMWMAGRVVFWMSIATELGRFPEPAEFGRLVPEHLLSSSAVSVTGLAAIPIFGLGIVRSVRPRPDRRVLTPLAWISTAQY